MFNFLLQIQFFFVKKKIIADKKDNTANIKLLIFFPLK